MATPITKTWLELKLLSGGNSCKSAEDVYDTIYPVRDDSTSMDALTICEAFRTAKKVQLIYPSIIRGMNAAQLKTIVIWALQKLSTHLPVSWNKTIEYQGKITDLIDCINAPTAGKKAALQTYSSSLHVDYGSEKDRLMTDLLRKIINLTVAGTTNVTDIADFILFLIDGAVNIAGLNKDTTYGNVLDKIELVIGIV